MPSTRSEQHRRSSSAETDTAAQSNPPRRLPWWRSGWMWVVIGIPAVTLAAAIVTTLIAFDHPDPAVEIAPGERPAHVRHALE